MYNRVMNKQDQRIQLVVSTEFRQEVDKWRRNQTDILSFRIHKKACKNCSKIREGGNNEDDNCNY